MITIRQFKLSSGDEICCEVIEWNDETTDLIVVRNCLEILYMMHEGFRVCTMRPYMLQQIHDGVFQTINSMHITIDARPTDETIKHWKEIVDYFRPNDDEAPDFKDEEIEFKDEDEDEDNIIDFPKPTYH